MSKEKTKQTVVTNYVNPFVASLDLYEEDQNGKHHLIKRTLYLPDCMLN